VKLEDGKAGENVCLVPDINPSVQRNEPSNTPVNADRPTVPEPYDPANPLLDPKHGNESGQSQIEKPLRPDEVKLEDGEIGEHAGDCAAFGAVNHG